VIRADAELTVNNKLTGSTKENLPQNDQVHTQLTLKPSMIDPVLQRDDDDGVRPVASAPSALVVSLVAVPFLQGAAQGLVAYLRPADWLPKLPSSAASPARPYVGVAAALAVVLGVLLLSTPPKRATRRTR
jgi:hypothetical protein